jgi:hypothetical protein
MTFKLLTKNIALDTSFIINQNFLAGARILDLQELMKDGLIHLYITDIVYRETLARFKENLVESSEKAPKSIENLQRQVQILRNFPDYSQYFTLPKIDISYLVECFKQKFDAWIDNFKIVIIPTGHIDCRELLDDYFNCRPPFSVGKNKFEFPDAFTCKSLLQYFKIKDEKAYLLTSDNGIKQITNEYLIPTDNPIELIDTIIRSLSEIKVNESIILIETDYHKKSEDIIYQLSKVLNDLIAEELSQLLEMEDDKNILIKQKDITEPSCGKISVSQLDIDSQTAQIEFITEFAVSIILLADDFENAWLDKATKTIRFLKQKEIQLHDKFVVPVTMNVQFNLADKSTTFSIDSINHGYGINIYKIFPRIV